MGRGVHVASQIVENHHIARTQRGDEGLLDPGGEAGTVEGAIEDQRDDDAVVAETGQEGQVL